MSRTVQFGLFDQSEQPGKLAPHDLYESRLRLAVAAEQAGFWGYHKSEHHLTPLDHAPSIGLFLAALAQRTRSLRLCSLCHLLPFYHPLRLYEEICMLDHLSNGRFEFGFGKGISDPEHRLWGLDPGEAIARTEETLQLLRAAFASDGDFSFAGQFYQFANVPLQLKPMQQPHPPLWRPGRLEAAAAMGVNTIVGGPSATVNESISRYQELFKATSDSERIGQHTPRIGALRKFIVAPTQVEALAIGRRAWGVYSSNLGKLFKQYGLPIPNDPTIGGDFERAQQVNAVVVGTAQQVREHIDALLAPGKVSYIVGSFSFGDLSHDESLRSLELFGEHIVAPLSH